MSIDGEYITNRLLPDFVQEACRDLGIEHKSFSDNWVHQLKKDSVQKWIIGYSFDINSTAASGLARDKVAATHALEASGVPTAKHMLARSRAMKSVLVENLKTIPDDQPVVIKPLEGASGHGVHRFETKAEAVHYLEQQPHTDWAMSPWYDIVSETRITLLDDDVVCAYEKREPGARDGLVLYNLGTGAVAVEVPPSGEVVALAQKARQTCGLRLAAVDVVKLRSGELLVLEVNEGIMMEHFARQSEEYRKKASDIYGKIVERMFEE